VGWTLGAQAKQNTLTATVAGTNVAGNPVAFTATGAPGSAGKLVIVTQPPATGESGIPLSPPPSVQLQDVNGNDVKQSGVAITAEIASGPSGATLSGATAATNNKGLATFSGLVLTGPAGQYTINFRGDNLSGVTSTPITLSAGGATKLAVLVPPSATAQSRVPFSQQPQIELQDPAGNRVARPGVNVLVTLSGQPAGGGSLGGGPTTIQTGADGIARFSGLLITGATGQYTLLFASGNLSSATAMVNLQNPAPTANADPYSTDEDASLTVAASGVLGNDSDPNGDPLTAVKLSNPAHGSVTLNSNGSFAYTPEPDFNGSDSFTYAANDGTQSSSPATVTITVNPVNDAPSFTMPDLTDEATSGLVPQTETRPGWVTGISAGPPNEGSQTVSFEMSTNSPGLFLDPPSITPDGTPGR